ncbi:WXG100 family type VII secretion target [Micromonospora olivasterospora]|uniref:Outer membrane channel protein CpnT-like N-terminal domain-containing protein n=1 Tax=Micromonospora olivasterospora TaxID=1880 RepID=A0A562ICC0_MICOL|nr:hypothetical protein [Micromonospora olivasterospora]TWH68641.1 hypothetical protein JD77_03638 [Micromonospora olivasterospora]
MTAPNPLVAQRVDSTTGWSGVGLAEDVELLVQAFRSGSWIDGAIGGFAAGLDALAVVVDPLGQLVSWGVAWLIEHFKPLSDALDWLAGDPDQVEAYAGTWSNVAAALRSSAADLDAAVAADLATWSGGAATAYRAHAGRQRGALTTMAAGADALAVVTTGTGLVVALVRELVRDLIADFVSVLAVRLWEWLAIAGGTLGAGTPWVVAQVSTLAARWAAKIARLLTGLIGSLRRVAPMLRRLNGVLGRLEAELRRLARHDPTTPPPAPPRRTGDLHSRAGTLSNREVMDAGGPPLPMSRETIDHYARLAGVDLDGVDVQVVTMPDDITYLDFTGAIARTDPLGVQLGPAAFQDEETLVRTLAHERVHVEQYRQGRVDSVTGPLEDEAYAAEEAFVDNWRRSQHG